MINDVFETVVVYVDCGFENEYFQILYKFNNESM